MENLESVLPFLRPRSAELTWYVLLFAFLLGAGLATLVILYALRRRRHKRQIEARFLLQAEEKGLASSQTRFLLQFARQNRMNNPLLLLNSVYLFDRLLGEHAARLGDRDPDDPILETIAQIRTCLGFDNLSVDQALRSTRQLAPGQTLMVWTEGDEGEGGTAWVIIGRDERAITVAPLLKEEDRQFDAVRPGGSLAVRFWREGDTEYRFAAEILAVNPKASTALLRHADRLERMQQRDFFRVQVRFPITFFVVPREAAETTPEEFLSREEEEEVREDEQDAETGAQLAFDLQNAPRLGGMVMDLSAGGLGLLIRNAVPPNYLLLVDPDFEGPFPLEGIFCEVVHAQEAPGGNHLQVHFVNLSPTREKKIVRQVYQHQIQGLQESEDEWSGRAEPQVPSTDSNDE